MRIVPFSLGIAAFGVCSVASASEFDTSGHLSKSAGATYFEGFEAPERYVPADAEVKCLPAAFEILRSSGPESEPLEGETFARVSADLDCGERFLVTVPPKQGSYRATVWIRHGSVGARMVVSYPAETGLPLQAARMSPTGRATSDGWIELATNDFPVDGTLAPNVYLRFQDFASVDGVDVDALEITPSGAFRPYTTCDGARDPVCGESAVCVAGECRLGDLSVPPLPEGDLKGEMVDALAAKLALFFGGKKTRAEDLPVALATIEAMRHATTPWEFWNGWATAIRQLHDWHTSASGPISEGEVRGRLNACFIEGDADLSHAVWPAHPVYRDILVSHSGPGAAGLAAGDRLVAIDGLHPIAWARQLIDVDWGYHVACDATSFADFVESLGGPAWHGGASILKYAKTISVVKCNAVTDTCGDTVVTIAVADLTAGGGGADVVCDNRPSYHLDGASPDASTHYVFYDFFQGPIAGTTPEEKIHGMVWDTLYGGGDPNGYVNGKLRAATAFWKASARGVILDHRAGNGGTLDAPEYLTQLVRPKEVFAVVRMPIEIAGFGGPATPAEGVALFQESKLDAPYTVGASDHDPALPVALITHRDGSASDYLPFGMKGAPKVKLFGPGPTAGAFSTYMQFSYWGGINLQLASGDTISKDGEALIGKGVMPDFVIQQKQSDLLDGIDTIHEAALAWVRLELKP